MLSMNTTLTAEQRVTKATAAILGHKKHIALAGVLMIGRKTVVPGLPTACTNGRDEMYGKEFVESLSDAELRFLILHETYHKLYRHLTTWTFLFEENAMLANMACDYVINLQIKDLHDDDGFAVMPRREIEGNMENIGCIDEKYRGWNTKQVYDDLKRQMQKCGGQGQGQGQSGGGLDEHDWQGAKGLSDTEKKQLERDIQSAVRQGAIAAGKVGSGGDRDFGDLLDVKVDWRDVLRDFVTETCAGRDYSTWNKPNRRYISSGIYMPSGLEERVGELLIGIDTSGSVGQDELNRFLSEVHGIVTTVKPSGIRLLYWDTEVCADELYGGFSGNPVDNLIQSTKPEGGGGTTPECVPQYMRDNAINVAAVVMLTDGYIGGWGTWSVPVLWCITNNPGTYAPVGRTVHVENM